MKKLVLGVVLAAILATGTAAADSPVHPDGLGIGILWGSSFGGYGYGGNIALSLKVPSMPIFWGITARIQEHWTAIGVQGDVYIMGSYFVGDILGWFLGIGGYGNFGFGNNNAAIGLGVRLPIGLTFQPIPLLEIFANITPQIGLAIWTGGDGGIDFPHGGLFGFEIGLRLWF